MRDLRRIALVTFENEIAWGLRNIAQFLRSNGFDVSLYFLERYANVPYGVPIETINTFVEEFAPTDYDVVGISFMTPYLEYARHLAHLVRAKGALVVVGGIHPTILPHDCKPFADYIIRGAGEIAMLKLLQSLSMADPPPRGVFLRDDQYWFNEDVTIFPHPRYGDVLDNVIVRGRLEKTDQVPRRIGPITRYQTFTSFGCPYRCTYCVNPILHDISHRRGKNFLRQRNIEDVTAELRHVKARIDTVAFEDEDFLVDTERAIAFLQIYKREIGLPFSCLVTPTTLKPETLERVIHQLKDAGCVSVTIGLQSASPRTAKLFQRPFVFEWLQRVAQAFAKSGILTTYDVILENPFEDATDVAKTVDAVLSLPHPFEVNIFYLTFFPGFVLTKQAKQHGIDIDSSGNTRLSRHRKRSMEEWVIRLAQVSCVPRSLLRFLYAYRSYVWSRWVTTILGVLALPLWNSRWISLLRMGLMHPWLVLVPLKKMRERMLRVNTS